jgi:molybdenum cofactor biosynthesis enzyme MoaA
MQEQPCPDRFLNIEPLRLSLKALQGKFLEILKSEEFTINEIETIELRFEFTEEFPDDYCSNCYALLVTITGKIFHHGVNYMGQSLKTTAEREKKKKF